MLGRSSDNDFFVMAYEATVAFDIGTVDSGGFTFKTISGHEATSFVIFYKVVIRNRNYSEEREMNGETRFVLSD